jgi:P27 family predicted phage terminase small subunit
MGKRGPPPLPDALRKVRGRPHRKKVEATAKPRRSVGAPVAPAHLGHDAIALATWERLTKSLTKMRVLTPDDGIVLEGLCKAYSSALQADAIVRRDGMIVKRKRSGGLAAHPAVKMSVQAWRDVRAFAQEFGLTPSSATRVRVLAAPTGAEKSQRNAEAFLFGGTNGKVIGHLGRGGRKKPAANSLQTND